MTAQNLKNLWVAEYNPNDGNFHVQTLNETINGNTKAALEGRTHSYLLIGVFSTADEAYVCCDVLANSLKAAGKKVSA